MICSLFPFILDLDEWLSLTRSSLGDRGHLKRKFLSKNAK